MAQKTLKDQLTDEQINQIIKWYTEENVSLREIEKRIGRGRKSIAKMLENLGIKKTYGNHYRKYFFNFDFFEKIDNELSAYWLGFLYADGSIERKTEANRYGEQSFKLALQEKDLEILEKMKSDFQSTYPIRYDKRKNENSQRQAILCMRSQKTVDDLKKLGCVENKSLILTFPNENQVPKEFLRDFIRGYFDGDGSISIYKGAATVNFVGTESFIKDLYSVIKIGSVYPDKRKTNSWYLNIRGNLQVCSFYHFLYDNANRYLERKFLKFQPLIKKYGESQGIKE